MRYYHGDVAYEVLITPADAGGTQRLVAFHTPSGHVRTITLTIPASVRSGDRVVVPGAGGPAITGDQYGDFYAVIRIVPQFPVDAPADAVGVLDAARRRGWPIRRPRTGAIVARWFRQLWSGP